MGQLLVVVQSRLKEIQTLVQLELIPDLYRHLLGATVIEIWDQEIGLDEICQSKKVPTLIPGLDRWSGSIVLH